MKPESTEAAEASFQSRVLQTCSADVCRPLWAVRVAAEVLSRSPRLPAREHELVDQIARNAARIEETFGLLLDRAVASAGPAMPLQREWCTFAMLAEQAVSSARAARPTRRFRYTVSAGSGHWDPSRVLQLLTAVLAHADEHAVQGAEATLSWRGTRGGLLVTVTVAPATTGSEIIGLRLAIARDIAHAHGGTLQAEHGPTGRLSISIGLPTGAGLL